MCRPTEMASDRRPCLRAGRVLLAVGIAVGAFSCTLPFLGEGLLAVLRGRPIVALDAQAILPKLLVLAAATGLFVGALLVSTGALLWRAESVKGLPVETQGGNVGPPHRTSFSSVALVLLLAAFFGAAELALAGRSLTYDEILAVEADVRTPWSRALETRSWDAHISGSLLARLSRSVFGETERGLRAASVGVGIAGIAGIGLWVLRIGGSAGAAVWLVTALGANALVLHTSKQIRGYGPLMWAGAAAILWTVSLLRSGVRLSSRLRTSVALGSLFLLAMLLGLSHLFGLYYLSFLALLVHVYLLKSGRVMKEDAFLSATVTAAAALTVVAWAPAFPWFFYWTSTPAGGDILQRIPREISVLFFGRPGMEGLGAVVSCLTALAGVWLWRKESEWRLLAAIGTIPFGLLLLAAFVLRPTYFFSRFLLLGLVLGLTVMSLALASVLEQLSAGGKSVILPLLMAGTVALLAGGVLELQSEPRGYREALEDVGNLLRWRERTGDARILPAASWASGTIIRYYAPPGLILSERQKGRVSHVIALVGDESAPPSLNEDGEKAGVPSWHVVVRGATYEPPVQVWGFGPP